MDATANSEASDPRKDIARRLVQVASSIIVTAVLLFASAGTLHWPFAWLYIGASIALIMVNTLMFPRELIAERGKKKDNVEPWDRTLTRLMLLPWTGLFVVAGLDHRFAWSPAVPMWLSAVGLGLFVCGSALVSWAMMSNRFFSTQVRIQDDRGHEVCTAGPYRVVRHPGYVGMIIYQLATPLIFASWWSFVPAGLTAVLFVLRTAREDQTLRAKLDGYADYATRVRWRLVPGVW